MNTTMMGLVAGLALGFAGYFGGFGAFVVVAVVGAAGLVVGRLARADGPVADLFRRSEEHVSRNRTGRGWAAAPQTPPPSPSRPRTAPRERVH